MKKALWILSVLPIIVTAFVLQFMPDSIPAHYNISGEIDRWGSKYESFAFPLAIIVITVIWEVILYVYNKKAKNASVDKKRAEILSNIKVMKITAVLTTASFAVLHFFNLFKAYTEADSGIENLELDSIKIVCVIMGILFIFLGNILPKTKLNGAIGLRITYSMYNDVTWSKSNRFGGIVLMISGLLTVISSLIFSSTVSIVLLTVYLVGAVIASVIYAKKIYEEEKAKVK